MQKRNTFLKLSKFLLAVSIILDIDCGTTVTRDAALAPELPPNRGRNQ